MPSVMIHVVFVRETSPMFQSDLAGGTGEEPRFSESAAKNNRKLAVIEQWTKNIMRELPIGDVGLVVAPEYFFRGCDDKTAPQFALPADEKNRICHRLKVIASRAPRVILVPGTIPWRDAATRFESGDLNYDYWRPASAPKAPSVSRYANAEAYLEFLKANGGIDASDDDTSEDDDDEVGEKEKRKAAAEKRGDAVFNTAPILYGSLLCEVDKLRAFEEVPRGCTWGCRSRARSIPLSVHGSRLLLGVDICLDHNEGELMRQFKGRPQLPDVHVILSDSTPNVRAHFCVRAGGVVVHASTQIREEESTRDFDSAQNLAPGMFRVSRLGHQETLHRSVHTGSGGTVDTSRAKHIIRASNPYGGVRVARNRRVSNVFLRNGLGKPEGFGFQSQRLPPDAEYVRVPIEL
ncbi:hypothetical protein MYSTI_02428 [Myxococcus stipitatus DSM 14675]|uniref:Uncharacterized protein n=2 Tax=Myxococcus stipitatus TaxID=83455 RepID=L7UBA1_MYXSD|nr:hypothetical protein MYSTI_02428 [Myxococcus stipitatus DSM 14675]